MAESSNIDVNLCVAVNGHSVYDNDCGIRSRAISICALHQPVNCKGIPAILHDVTAVLRSH